MERNTTKKYKDSVKEYVLPFKVQDESEKRNEVV